jgi:hypothetical protein
MKVRQAARLKRSDCVVLYGKQLCYGARRIKARVVRVERARALESLYVVIRVGKHIWRANGMELRKAIQE